MEELRRSFGFADQALKDEDYSDAISTLVVVSLSILSVSDCALMSLLFLLT